VSAIPPHKRVGKYDPSGEFAIAVGSSPNNNGSTLCIFPGRGIKALERLDVSLLKVPYLYPPSAAHDLPPTPQPPNSDSPVHFHSNNPQLDQQDMLHPSSPVGTLGTDFFTGKQQIHPPQSPMTTASSAEPPRNTAETPRDTEDPTRHPGNPPCNTENSARSTEAAPRNTSPRLRTFTFTVSRAAPTTK
jgi:hypothetical protein